MTGAIVLSVAIVFCNAHAPAAESGFYVATNGNDSWSGKLSAPNAEGTDGPFATLDRARRAVGELKKAGALAGRDEPVNVQVRGGTYYLSVPLVFSAADSGTPAAPIVYCAFPGEKPVVSGGRRIAGWQADADGRWKAGAARVDNTRQLYVNGVRARRARGGQLPGAKHYGGKSPLAALAGYTTTDGSMAKWRNQSDIEFGYFVPVWSHKILKVDHIRPDGKGGAIVNMLQPWFWLGSTSGYIGSLGSYGGPPPHYMENAFELLDEPGEWYLDRTAKVLYYIPEPGEDMGSAEVIAPVLEKLLEVKGTIAQPAHDIRFEGITFCHATWLRPSIRGHSDCQANFIMRLDNLVTERSTVASIHGGWLKSPANIVVDAAKAIRFEGCTFTKLGGAGIDLQHGARDNVISGCEFDDISGTAIQVGDVRTQDHHPDDKRLIVKNNHVVNNYIHDAGAEYLGSVGIFAGYTEGTVIAHNEISHLPYSGMSVGWGWGNPDVGGDGTTIPWTVYDTPTTCKNNRIEYNHIHHVLQKRADGGGIYTLGDQPGTVIRGNHIHDNGGGPGGIYLDQGSGYIEITGNVVYKVPRVNVNYNNNRAGRRQTCKEHDNYFGNVALRFVQAPGKVGKAMAGGVVNVPHSPALEPANITAEAWVYLRAFPRGRERRRWIVGKGHNEAYSGHYALVIWNKKVSTYLNIEGGTAGFHQATTMTDVLKLKRWHHLAMTYDGAILRLYVDGILSNSTKVNKARIPGRTKLSIGRRPDGHTFFTRGRIDEVRVYDRVLPASQIMAHFKNPAAVPPKDKGLVGYWGFEAPPDASGAEEIIEKAGLEPAYREKLLN